MMAADPYGAIERAGDRYRVRFERNLRHPVDRVWAALTEPAQLRAWLAAADLDLVPGGRVRLEWLNVPEGEEPAIAEGTVSALDPPRTLELDTDLHGRLRFELEPDAATGGTRLVFTVEHAIPDDQLARTAAGWHVHLEHLADALEGDAVDWSSWWTLHFPRWEEHHEA